MKIVVSSDCQTAAIAAGLKALLPSSTFVAIPMPAADDEAKNNALIDELGNADVWVTAERQELAEGKQIEIIRLPYLQFSAFHPDLTYATTKSTNELTNIHYNSQIAVWAYNNEIEPSDAARLFNGQTFKALGYFERWAPAVAHLRSLFTSSNFSNLEFDKLFNSVKRIGVFMHSVNHPRPQVIVELTKLVARRLKVTSSTVDREIIIPDWLATTIWPLYPEVGNELGLDGHYHWRLIDKEMEGVRAYLDFAYQEYKDQGIAPKDLVATSQIHNLDATLRAQVGK